MAARDNEASKPDPATSWATSAGTRRSMQGNRSQDTGPELRLRSELHQRGLRFRKNLRVTAGGVKTRADVVFTAARVAVFVDGCFWHRCPDHGTDPRRNSDYWAPKLDANVARDRRVDAALAADGWHVMRVWEHEPAAHAADRIDREVRRRRVREAPRGPAAAT